MKDAETLARAGANFGAARLKNIKQADVPIEFLPTTEEEGYAIQDASIEWLSANGLGPQVGYKVANVSAGAKEMLVTMGAKPFGLDTPLYGPIMSRHIYHELAEIDPFDNEITYIECEFGIRMGRDTPAENQPYTRESIGAYIDACMAGIEIAAPTFEKRDYEDVAPRGILNIADNGSNRGAVFGPPVTDWQKLDIPSLTARIIKNGEEVLSGDATGLMGHPFEVAAWLANRLIDDGKQLKAGEYVLLGSVTRGMKGAELELASGEEVIIRWDELGDARVKFN